MDPNTFSPDGTSSLSTLTVSGDGRLVAYGVSEAGSDWTTFRLLNLASGDEVDDALIQTKFSQAEWLPDHRCYVYTHFDHEGGADGTQTAALPGPKLRLHRIGDTQDHDELIMEFPENDQLMFWGEVTDDDRYLVVSIVEGTENRNRLWVYPIIPENAMSSATRSRSSTSPLPNLCSRVRTPPRSIFEQICKPLRGRLIAVDLESFKDSGQPRWQEVVAESEHTLLDARAAGDGFILVYLADAQPRIVRVSLDGSLAEQIEVAGGAVVGLNAKRGDPEAFIGLSSVTSPTAQLPDPDRLSRHGLARRTGAAGRRRLCCSADRGGASYGDQQGRYARALFPYRSGRCQPVAAPADPAVRVWRIQDSGARGLPTGLAMLVGRGWPAGDRQPAGWGRVRYSLVRSRSAGIQTERFRRLCGGRRAPETDRGHDHANNWPCTAEATGACWWERC